MAKLIMNVLWKLGRKDIVFTQFRGGTIKMCASARSEFIKPLKLKAGDRVIVTIQKLKK